MTRIEFDATVIPPAQVIANELGLEVEELQAWDTYDDGFNDVRTIVTQHTLFRADAPDGTTWQIDLDLATGEGVAELVTDETETASQEEVEDMVGAALAIFN